MDLHHQIHSNGAIERYQVRLVAKRYTQIYEVDYRDTFALVAKMNTIRIPLSLRTILDWPLQQFDVKNTFFHGDLENDLYMDVPPGYVHKVLMKKVCRFRNLFVDSNSPYMHGLGGLQNPW